MTPQEVHDWTHCPDCGAWLINDQGHIGGVGFVMLRRCSNQGCEYVRRAEYPQDWEAEKQDIIDRKAGIAA